MACGVPCVVTDVGDSARIVGETGAVVPLRDPDALCAAWASLLDLNAESRRARGLRARERIRDQYSIGAVAAQYVKLYEDVARE